MATPLTPQTVQRLAFIRFLYEQGTAQAGQPQPIAATSVLSFHDSVELFLVLAGEHLQVNLPTQINFSEYWGKLAPKLPSGSELPSKKAMERMNKLRVNLKHHGAIPSPTDIAQVKADVTTFFTDATQLVFGGSFTEIDMIDLVTRVETVQLLQDAHTHALVGDFPSAMAGLRIAFTELIDHYTEHRTRGARSPFRFGPTVTNRPFDHRNSRDETLRQLDKVSNATEAIQRAMRVISLGIDYARYAQFEILAPVVHGYMDGSRRFVVDEGHKLLSEGDYQFGRLFLIESALQAAKADSVLQRRNDHRQANSPQPGVWAAGDERTWEGPAH
ncbi:hypothetical protein ACIOC1_35520 [Streptomyces sp. NPDC088197]|uniref:hypothetical protein n=1 Tax=Streptomyces sp. NPDC088197 TaxID=3365840 RepID=UPI003803A337